MRAHYLQLRIPAGHSAACLAPLHCRRAACPLPLLVVPPAGKSPAAWALTNWTMGQPLASKPGEAYAYSDDAYSILTYVVEKVGTQGGCAPLFLG